MSSSRTISISIGSQVKVTTGPVSTGEQFLTAHGVQQVKRTPLAGAGAGWLQYITSLLINEGMDRSRLP